MQDDNKGLSRLTDPYAITMYSEISLENFTL